MVPRSAFSFTSRWEVSAYKAQVLHSLELRAASRGSFWNSTCSSRCDLVRLPPTFPRVTTTGGVNRRYPPPVFVLAMSRRFSKSDARTASVLALGKTATSSQTECY